MDTVTYSQPNDPNSWSADLGEVLQFKFASNEDARLASEFLNQKMTELDHLRAINAELEIFIKGALAALSQPAAFPADIEAAKSFLKAALTKAGAS